MPRSVVAAVLVALVGVGCSGSTINRVVVMSSVDSAMTKAGTLRFEVTGGRPSKTVDGEADWAHGYVTEHLPTSGGGDFATLQEGPISYIRDGGTWCRGPNLGLLSPFDALHVIRRQGAALVYVGTEPVRGAAARHFRINGANTFDIWVDVQDRLRRLSGSDVVGPFSIEFFDFGVPVTFTPPAAPTPSCANVTTP